MEEKQKGKELIEKFLGKMPDCKNYEYEKDSAKDCAILHCQEMIKQCEDFQQVVPSFTIHYRIDFYNQVLQYLQQPK